MKYLKILKIIGFILIFNACENLFEFSVYEANVKKENQNTTAINLELLKNVQVESDNFKFAFLSDAHYFYNNLKTVVDHINKNDEIKFVIFGGDIADQALLKEYEIFYDIMKYLKKPYLTVIGNHDYNANGGLIYQRMFGDYNYSFEFDGNKFILFDSVVWESKKDPDFDWLSTELMDNANYKQVFVVAHIPPFGEQFTEEMEQKYRTIMEVNNVPLSIHGHTHRYSFEEGVVNYLTVPALKDTAYSIISVINESFNVELIEL